MLTTSSEDIGIGGPPPENATAIGVLDSGILVGHPLLKAAVRDAIAMGTRNSSRIRDGRPEDEVGHGTKVAGIALYGDLYECLQNRQFTPVVWILSAKVMYAETNPINGQVEAKYDEEELLESQLEDAVRRFRKSYPNFRVVNLSLGNEYKRMFGGKRQFNLAALIDELARELQLVFVIAGGNFGDYHRKGYPGKYPEYLLEETEEVKIIDPATAALGITVGSITQPYGPSLRSPSNLLFSPANTNYPSPFTRVGPGYQRMVKPEVVEEGGNIIEDSHAAQPDIGGKLITLDPDWLRKGTLFAVDHGTSFSAPQVAHYIGRLFNKYPNYSPNLIKALLISSAQIPSERPAPLSEIGLDAPDSNLGEVLKVYGYGKPRLERALYCTNKNVLLVKDNTIHLDTIHVYYFYLPNAFVDVPGTRQLAVTLVYDPPVNKNRVDYLGCSMTFRLFRDMEVDEVIAAYERTKARRPDEEAVPKALQPKEISLHPGVTLRKKGAHQKGVAQWTRGPRLDTGKPLVLAVICQNKWIRDEQYVQDYAVVVAVEHAVNVDLEVHP
jgi:hypothetical protein